MGWLLVTWLANAYEPKEVALAKTAARRMVKINPQLAKIKAIPIRILKWFNMYYWFVIYDFTYDSGILYSAG